MLCYALLSWLCYVNVQDARNAFVISAGSDLQPHNYHNISHFSFFQKSCAEIKEIVPGANSGYYWINVKGKKKEVFCDMVNYGMF